MEENNTNLENADINNEVTEKQPDKTNKKNNKKRVIIIVVLLILAVGAFVGYKVFTDKPEPKKKDKSETKEYLAYRITDNSLSQFDIHFLQLENKEENKIYSPLSIKYALEMLGEGAEGTSKNQIDDVIGEYKAKSYTNSSNMSFSNALFIQDGYKKNIKDDYIKKLNTKYNAEIIFDSFATPDNLNKWVNDKTFGLINNLFDDVSEYNFILTNALAIDMEWNKRIQADAEHYKDEYSVSYDHEKYYAYVPVLDENRFSKIKFNDKDEVNTLEIGASINNYDIVKTLGEDKIRKEVGDAYQKWLDAGECGDASSQTPKDTYLDKYMKELNANYKKVESSTDFTFVDDDNVKAFAKDLKTYDGTTLQYVGIMPKETSLKDYIADLKAKDVKEVIDNLKEIKLENFEEGKITKITGNIPIFKYDYQLDLMNDLKKMGIEDVFDINKANLKGITDKTVVIGKATHKANIEFSNEGIKASAATALGGMGAAGCWFTYDFDVPVVEIDLTFDKPYLYLIRDKESGEVWFAGTVYEPSTN